MKAKDRYLHGQEIQGARAEGFRAGIKEATDWVRDHGRMTYARASGEVTFDHINWQTKLKEWGIKDA